MLNAPITSAPRAARTNHTMKPGESLASVALKHYGDARYARLLYTINRADIPTRSDGFSSFAFVSPGQSIALPTYEEANIFSRHFFTKQSQNKFDLSHYARPAMPSDSIPVTILPSLGSRSANDLSQSSGSSIHSLLPALPHIELSGVPSAEVATAGARGNQFECQYKVRMPAQQLEPEVIDMSPPTVKVPALQYGAPPPEGPEVVTFSHYCSMIKFDAEGGQSDTVIKLQVKEESRWQTITAYIITEETSRRVAHYADKHDRAVKFDLPCAVARELSISDLKRNWKEYVQCYLKSQAKIAGFPVAAENGLLQAC
jgi:hypothetical protein